MTLPKLGYVADCQDRFELGETVPVLCMVDGGMYRVRVRKRGAAKSEHRRSAQTVRILTEERNSGPVRI